ncbi:MAG: hypothetical protein Q9162_002122 [Coniocarpon cinnabarinum]
MASKMTMYKLAVLGDGGVGKTALTIQLCLNHFVETYDPTIEDSYRKQVVIDNQSCMLEVLDTAGQEEYTALRDQWIRDGEGFVLVYSITSRASFSRIQSYYKQILRVRESVAAMSPVSPGALYPGTSVPMTPTSPTSSSGPAQIMLVGNKVDRTLEREVSTQEGSALAKQMGCDFIETSAKSCINVEKAFFDVVRNLRRQRNVAERPDRRVGGNPPPGGGGGPGGSEGRIRRGGRRPTTNKCVIL